MGYLDSDGLKRFAQNVKNKAMWNWQWTKTAPCVHFWPGEETELEPVVDFLFKEIPPAEGEKGPDNPSTIEGVSKVVLGKHGKNLLLQVEDNLDWYGLSITSQPDGSYLINGTFNDTNQRYFPITDCGIYFINTSSSIKLDRTKKYTLSVTIASGTITGTPAIHIGRRDAESNIYSLFGSGNLHLNEFTSKTLTSPASILPDNTFVARLNVNPGDAFDNVVIYIQMEEGEEATDFEAPLPISYAKTIYSLNSTYAGGTVNLKTGELIITHNFLQLSTDNTYGWDETVNCLAAHYNPNSKGRACSNEICSHFPFNEAWSSTTTHFYQGLNNTYMFNSAWTTKQDGLDFIAEQQNAGTPVTVVYELGEPQTIQLTPQQILSLPRLDHYVPRMNTVYTDQQSVKVGYKKIDNVDSHSDEEISGTKTFASSPLVPNPNDLDSQQTTPISFTKDMMRAEIEALTSGRNTIVRDQWGNPHIMVVMPKFMLSAIDPSWPNEPHPAFIVNGVEKSEVLIGKYLASKSSANRVQTLPGQFPWAYISFDESLAACRALGNSFGMNTNAIWSARALWLWKTMPSDHEYLGNRNYGRTGVSGAKYAWMTGTMANNLAVPGTTGVTDASNLTGSGGTLWNDDETPSGIADFVGNLWEWNAGIRINYGEINIIPNNDAILPTSNMASSSTEWKAILQDGTFVAPGTANTLKFDSLYPDKSSWSNVGAPTINTTISNTIINGYNGVLFKNLNVAAGITIPPIFKYLGIFPASSNVGGAFWSRTDGECMLRRGDGWSNGVNSNPFEFYTANSRPLKRYDVGFRTAYIP